MRKLAFAIVLLAACGRKPQGPTPLTITITHDGFVKVEGKAVTLDELGTLLAARRDAAPLEDVAWAKVSSLPVLLDVEDDALWTHVNLVMTAVAEQSLRRLALPGGRETLLPVNSSHGGAADGTALLVRLLVLETGDYVLGDRKTRDVAELGSWIDAALRGKEATCRIGAIRARPRVTWRRVRPVFDLLRQRGFERIELWEVLIPSREERGRALLPAPRAQPYRPSSGIVELDCLPNAFWYDEWMIESLSLSSEEQLVALLDGHRLDLGLARLGTDEPLWKAARLHADEMDRMGYFGHFSPTSANRSPGDRLAMFGWPEGRRHAELLAQAETADAAFQAILAKPENASILADPAFRYAGVAQSGDCWVVVLGAER